MEINLERDVMDNMLMAHFITGKENFRYNEIVHLSNMKRPSSLRRVLDRLVERGWIEKSIPKGRVFHFTDKKEARQETYKEFADVVGFPSDKRDLFKAKLRNYEEETRMLKIPKFEKEKILRRGRIKGRKKILDEILTEKKEIILYKITEYPFVYNSTKKSQEGIKEGTKRFWINSSKDFIEFRNKFFKEEIIRAGSVDAILKKYSKKRKKSNHNARV